jgi:hypothetical protein
MSESFTKLRSWASTLVYQVKLLGRLAGIVAIAAATMLCQEHLSRGYQTQQDVIRKRVVSAEILVLGSPAAKRIAMLAVDPTNQVSMLFLHMQNSRFLQVGLFGEGSPSVDFRSSANQSRMTLSVPSSGNPRLRLMQSIPRGEFDLGVRPGDSHAFIVDDAGKNRISFSAPGPKGDTAVLAFSDKKGNSVIRFSYSNKITHLSLDNEENLRAIVGLLPGKPPGFLLYDRALIPLFEMTTDDENRPLIRLNDPVARESHTFK